MNKKNVYMISSRVVLILVCILLVFSVEAMTDLQFVTNLGGDKKADWFGFSVDIDYQTIVTGIPKDDTMERNAGAVEIGSLVGESYIPLFQIYGDQKSAQFGYAVSVSDNIVADHPPCNHNARSILI